MATVYLTLHHVTDDYTWEAYDRADGIAPEGVPPALWRAATSWANGPVASGESTRFADPLDIGYWMAHVTREMDWDDYPDPLPSLLVPLRSALAELAERAEGTEGAPFIGKAARFLGLAEANGHDYHAREAWLLLAREAAGRGAYLVGYDTGDRVDGLFGLVLGSAVYFPPGAADDHMGSPIPLRMGPHYQLPAEAWAALVDGLPHYDPPGRTLHPSGWSWYYVPDTY